MFRCKYGEAKLATRIRNVIMKKIWRIPLFLMIIITLGVSILVAALVYIPRSRSTITILYLGRCCLIDGYHVEYGNDLEARWTIREFWFQSDGRFLIDLQFDYISEDPEISKIYFSINTTTVEGDFEYVGSTILLMVSSAYRRLDGTYFRGEDLTDIIPITANSTNLRLCFARYGGQFNLPRRREGTTSRGIAVIFSWIRVFREKNDEELYYQWMQGSDVWKSEKAEVNKTYSNISGGFLVYYPIPESVTSPLLVRPSYEFDYIKWIKENM